MGECDEAVIEVGECVNDGQTAVTGECTSFGNVDCSTELENRSKVLIISNEEVRKNFLVVLQIKFLSQVLKYMVRLNVYTYLAGLPEVCRY